MASTFRCGVALAALILSGTGSAGAQALEVAPIAGYRFGGDFFELMTGQPVDTDGARAVGVAVDVPLYGGFQIEGLFTHQHAHITTVDLFGGRNEWRATVDHWQAGGLQELGGTRVRPFLTGMAGLTRYAIEADSELRLVLGGGGGVKLFPTPRLGLRLDGRVFATLVDVGGRTVCIHGPCVVALALDVVWQAEFTAGVVVRIR